MTDGEMTKAFISSVKNNVAANVSRQYLLGVISGYSSVAILLEMPMLEDVAETEWQRVLDKTAPYDKLR